MTSAAKVAAVTGSSGVGVGVGVGVGLVLGH
jgi:hypothetical protein